MTRLTDETHYFAGQPNLETGWLCLDFANTAIWHASETPDETINSYDDLAAWAEEEGIISAEESRSLLQEALESPHKAEVAHKNAISLREAVYRLFSSYAAGRESDAIDLNILNNSLKDAVTHLQIVQTDGEYSWEWSKPEGSLDFLLWYVARSASNLLISEMIERVGECADDRGCGWLFMDMSKNRSRRWCDMRDCGNREKVRQYYKRKRDTELVESQDS